MLDELQKRVLIEVLGDKELDVFGIYKKRRKELEARQNLGIIKIQEEKKKQRMIKSYENICRVLIDTYGKEGAIPYLKVLFKQLNSEGIFPPKPKVMGIQNAKII